MKVAIIGGSGFIGRHVTARLTARGEEVTWLSRDPGRVAAVADTLGVARVVPFKQETQLGPGPLPSPPVMSSSTSQAIRSPTAGTRAAAARSLPAALT